MADFEKNSAVLPIPFPELHGHGLLLSSWDPGSEEDVEAYLRGLTDPDFRRWNTPLRTVVDRQGAHESLRSRAAGAANGTSLSFRITDAACGTTLGHIGVNEIDHVMRTARVGYWVLPEARGRGVATRALDLAACWALADLGLNRLELGHALGHDASCRIAERCGFRYEGTLRGAMFAAGRQDAFRDVHLHGRIASDPEPTVP
ncbi:GNAT family N-acetyltransferase [Streptomyces chiangmaiensis]|uniref:GNAT family N-acetyltransferase n=1 Tax=Streptomyces chiangmaiensis TaxID=766497 RepID=A0ABU7FAS3_9ACTN|nr:GNAT family N-acetyltransferase [Streptomyces chiangmaiensis]MED7821282.1 GNAT family N-acetyltransferase [Streptomyces chiangmaiensis]